MRWFRTPPDPPADLSRRLQWFLLLRVATVTFLLGATAAVHIRQTSSFTTIPLLALYLLIGMTYFFTLVSALFIRRMFWLEGLTFMQIIWEVVFITGLIYVTSGTESIFSFMYLLAVVTASILLYRLGAYLAAVLSAISYSALLLGLHQGWIPPLMVLSRHPDTSEVLWNVFINVVAFLAVAFLSSILTDQLRAASFELKEAQEDRDQIEALNDSVVRSISSGLITLDQEDRITSFNQAAAQITGFLTDQVLGRDLDHVFPGLDPATMMAEADTAHDNAVPQTLIFKMPHENLGGQVLLLEVIISSLFDPLGRVIGWLVIFSDITQLREMEGRLRQADRLAAVGQLAAGMAHEIRNPLAAISGSIQMLEQGLDLDADGARLIKIVHRETDRLDHLITEFLLFARPHPRCIEAIDVGALIQDMLSVFANKPDVPDGIDIKTELALDLILESDPGLIKQVLWNLINNAVEAMSQGGQLRISTRTIMDADQVQGLLEVTIEDTGMGISNENLSRIFDPFFTTRERGTGLGLSTVYRVVETLAGDVSVESQPGRGSTFIVRIPLKPMPETEAQGAAFGNIGYGGLPGE